MFASMMPDKHKATKNSLKNVISLMKSYDTTLRYVTSKWKSKNPLGPDFPA